MIGRLIGRLFAVIFGFLFGTLAGAITLFLLGARWAAEEAASYTPDHADDISRIFNEGLGVLAFFVEVTPLLTLLPALAVVVIGEVAQIRSSLYYIFASGAAAALMPVLSAPPEFAASPSYSGEYFAIVATAGFVGGFIYWLAAGRNA